MIYSPTVRIFLIQIGIDELWVKAVATIKDHIAVGRRDHASYKFNYTLTRSNLIHIEIESVLVPNCRIYSV